MRLHRNYVFLIPLLAIAFAYQAYYTAINVDRQINGHQLAAPPFDLRADAGLTNLTKAAENAGLRRGDRLVSIAGKPLTGLSAVAAEWEKRHPGDSVEIGYSRGGGGTASAIVRLPAFSATPNELRQHLIAALFLVMPWFCLLLGAWVILAKPADSQASAVFLMLLGFTNMVTLTDVRWVLPEAVRPVLLLYQAIAQGSWPFAMLFFGLYFPERFAWERRFWWAKWILAAPLLVLLIAGGGANVLAAANLSAVAGLERFLVPLNRFVSPLMFAMIGGCFALLGYKQGTAKNPDSRRRLRLLLWGGGVGMGPAGALFAYTIVTGRGNPFSGGSPWLILVIALMFLFPLTLAYVIVVHRALGIAVVVRQGLQYGLARGGVRVIQIAVVLFAIYHAVNLLTDVTANRPRRLQAIALAGVVVLASRRGAEKLLKWVDRKFFRDAYDAELVLSELSDSVRAIVEEKPLLETVSRKISEVLHVPQVAVLLNGDGAFRPAYACGFASPVDVTIPERARTADQLAKAKDPPQIFEEDKGSWVHQLPASEREALATLGSRLLLPLATKQKLLGFLSLGPKQSDEPYSRSDVRMLKSLAAQTGLALENTRLTASIASEIAQREKLNREMEIAREVQERLFPQKLPPIDGIDYWGYCRPALGVGGDYYDFLQLPGGDFGIAIGDVSGKGIAAALLMASLQASLRSQATQDSSDLARIMRNVNRLVFDATPSNKYATFFYAQFERAAGRLLFCNGGHNAPMIFRKEDGEWRVLRCDAGGPAVGLFAEIPYEMGSIDLLPGDVIVGFTDGVSEAMNHDDDEFGEERLAPAVIEALDKPAREIIPAIMAAADAFAGGAPQHDDMTLVVVKLTAQK